MGNSKKVKIVTAVLALVSAVAVVMGAYTAYLYRRESAEGDRANVQIEALSSDVYDLESEIAALNLQIETLQNRVTDAEEDYSELQTDYDSLVKNVGDITDELSAKETELKEAVSELEVKNKRITALEKKLNKQLDKYGNAVEEKNRLTDEVAELEEQIALLEADVYRLRTAAAISSVTEKKNAENAEIETARQTEEYIGGEEQTENSDDFDDNVYTEEWYTAYVPSGEISEEELYNLLQYGVPLKWYKNADGTLYRARSQFTAYGYYDITSGESMLYNADTVYYSASLIKAPYIYSVLLEISEFEKNAARDENGSIIYGEGEEKYNLDEMWTYDPETMFEAGSGEIVSMPAGTQMTWRELFSYVLLWSDNVAWNQIMDRFGFTTFYRLVGELGIRGTSSDFMDLSVNDCIKFLREMYDFFETGEPLALFMKENMMKSKHDVMICASFPEDTVPHKYGWDTDSYHDMAIIYDEHPYIIVIMTDLHDGTDEDNAFVHSVVEMTKEIHEGKYE